MSWGTKRKYHKTTSTHFANIEKEITDAYADNVIFDGIAVQSKQHSEPAAQACIKSLEESQQQRQELISQQAKLFEQQAEYYSIELMLIHECQLIYEKKTATRKILDEIIDQIKRLDEKIQILNLNLKRNLT